MKRPRWGRIKLPKAEGISDAPMQFLKAREQVLTLVCIGTVRVGRSNDVLNPVLLGEAAHFHCHVPRLRTIVNARKDVAVNIDHVLGLSVRPWRASWIRNPC